MFTIRKTPIRSIAAALALAIAATVALGAADARADGRHHDDRGHGRTVVVQSRPAPARVVVINRDDHRDDVRLGTAVANLLTAAIAGPVYPQPAPVRYVHTDRCYPVVTHAYYRHGHRFEVQETACHERHGGTYLVPSSRVVVERY